MGTWKSYLRFTIRELALLTVIVGLALAWALDHQRLQGPLRYTGNPLDLAIAGNGFFSLIDQKTLVTVYTSRGEFCVNAEGILVARSGGAEWPVCPQISIPSNATGISISPSGRVSVQQPGNTSLICVGQLQLAMFDQPGKLRRIALSVHAQTDGAGPAVLGIPGAGGFGKILQGVVNGSAPQKFSFSPNRP
jgi:flagellar basal-body rod protein FlgG